MDPLNHIIAIFNSHCKFKVLERESCIPVKSEEQIGSRGHVRELVIGIQEITSPPLAG